MICLLIFLYDGRSWLRQYTQPLQHFTSHLGIYFLFANLLNFLNPPSLRTSYMEVPKAMLWFCYPAFAFVAGGGGAAAYPNSEHMFVLKAWQKIGRGKL